ncbi:relaxase/mobilization nuclease domain-containing protein [Streptococcus alactolyticus]|uniref:relaxase/mobilization nuclease domain-containing protein n=1 Tax=Streptococcus alactolyticus TaxID=29389 RepID=UPI003F9E4324
MAYIKIFPIKATVNNAVNYVTNPDKTEEQQLVSSFGCSPETAELEFEHTRSMASRNNYDRQTNLARHLIISFKPGEISDSSLAHEIGQRIVDEILKGKYEYVLSTHVDKGHIHCHVIFNDVSFVDHHRYRSNKRSYHKLCKISNRICREYGLSENMPTGNKGKSYKEYQEYHTGNSWKAKLKIAVDKAIWSSTTYDDFLEKMKKAGYEVRQGKYLAFRAPDQKHFTNVKTLGSYYTEEKILERLSNNLTRLKQPRNISRKMRLIVQMNSYVANNDYPGYDRFAKLHELKESAKTFNYLSEHNLLNYEDFKNHVADVNAAMIASEERIKTCDNKIQQQQLIQKKCHSYRICRDIIKGEANAPDKAAYRKKHKREYQLHDSLLADLKALGIEKLPSEEKLSKKLSELLAEKNAVVKEKQMLQKQQETLSVVQDNFQHLLDQSGIQYEKDQSHTQEEIL